MKSNSLMWGPTIKNVYFIKSNLRHFSWIHYRYLIVYAIPITGRRATKHLAKLIKLFPPLMGEGAGNILLTLRQYCVGKILNVYFMGKFYFWGDIYLVGGNLSSLFFIFWELFSVWAILWMGNLKSIFLGQFFHRAFSKYMKGILLGAKLFNFEILSKKI